MDVEFETRWRKLLTVLEERFGGGMDLQDILFLVGVKEWDRDLEPSRRTRRWT